MINYLEGQLVDIFARRIYPARLSIENGRIVRIEERDSAPNRFLLPPFIDAHVHVESSLLVPTEFARMAMVHGTVASVSDPHEIGNVLGVEGVQFMLDNAAKSPFKFCFGAPSCVPATPFETAGATITAADIETLFQDVRIGYLAEMMNWPGVLNRSEEVMEKIRLAQRYGRPVDGHAPGLKGEDAARYASAGISTDHECFTQEEAEDKLRCGMKVLIREGSAARNFEALAPLIPDHLPKLMFCSDDKHPDSLLEGHINQLVSRSVKKGYDLFSVLQIACRNPVEHYRLPVGLLRVGDPADLVITEELEDFRATETWINGVKVAENGKCLLPYKACTPINQFVASELQLADLAVEGNERLVRIIEAYDGELVTGELKQVLPLDKGTLQPDLSKDILKLVVVNRYQQARPAVAFIKGIGLKKGALASSVAHDSHNIIAVGCSDEDLLQAIQLVMKEGGGLSAASGSRQEILPLPVAGLMSDRDGAEVAAQYIALDKLAKELGSPLRAPYMTLSFMALLVIPDLKLSDKGLFDGQKFSFTPLQP